MLPGSRENAGLPTLIIYFLHLNVFRNNFLPLHWSDALPLTLLWPFYGSEQGHMAVSALWTCRLLSDLSHLYSDVSSNQVCEGVRQHGKWQSMTDGLKNNTSDVRLIISPAFEGLSQYVCEGLGLSHCEILKRIKAPSQTFWALYGRHSFSSHFCRLNPLLTVV